MSVSGGRGKVKVRKQLCKSFPICKRETKSSHNSCCTDWQNILQSVVYPVTYLLKCSDNTQQNIGYWSMIQIQNESIPTTQAICMHVHAYFSSFQIYGYFSRFTYCNQVPFSLDGTATIFVVLFFNVKRAKVALDLAMDYSISSNRVIHDLANDQLMSQ